MTETRDWQDFKRFYKLSLATVQSSRFTDHKRSVGTMPSELGFPRIVRQF
jgi:hypothetical protein